jgi:hypothetical protein
MPHQGGDSRASMATNFAKAPVSVEEGSSPRTGPAASALGRLAHLLARQAAREATLGLGTEQHPEGQPATEPSPGPTHRQAGRSAP